MDKIRLDQRILDVVASSTDHIKASKEQLKRIENLSMELTEVCDMSPEIANQLIFYSIIKWQNETELTYEEGLIMTYTERVKHKSRMFEIGKDCILQLISSPEDIVKINAYIDRKMYEYLARLTESNQSE